MTTEIDVEAMIREADPALRTSVPHPDAARARQIRESANPGEGRRPVPRRRVLTAAAGVAAAALLLFAATALLTGRSTTIASAETVLKELAATAGEAPALEPGEFAYTETTEPVLQIAGLPFRSYLVGTVRTWVAMDGSGRQTISVDPVPRFETEQDRQAWIDAGSPPLGASPSDPLFSNERTFGPGEAAASGAATPLYDARGLPTDPDALRTLLATGTTGIPGIDDLGSGLGDLGQSANFCSTPDCETFVRATRLLTGPTIGTTPELRQALLRILSEIPGVTYLGDQTDPIGRPGLAFAYNPTAAPTATSHDCGASGSQIDAPSGLAFRLVVDRATSSVLSTQTRYTDIPTPDDGCAEDSPGYTDDKEPWRSRIILQSGIVNSTEDTPSGS